MLIFSPVNRFDDSLFKMAARRAFRQRVGSDSDDDAGVIVRAGRAAAPPAAKRPVWATHGDDGDEDANPEKNVAVTPQMPTLQPAASKASASSRPTYMPADFASVAEAQPATASVGAAKPIALDPEVSIVGDVDDLSEDVLARKAAAARAHREQQRKRNAFGSLLVSGSGGVGSSRSAGAGAGASISRGGTSVGSLSRSAAAGAAAGGYDYDSYSDEKVSLPAGAADVAALRSALGRGQTRPVGSGGGRSLALHIDADDHDDGQLAAPAGATAGLRRLGAAPISSALATSSSALAGAPVHSGIARAPSADAIPAWEAEQLRRAMGGSAAAADAERRAAQTARDLAVLKSTSAAVAAASALSTGPGRGMAVDDDDDGDRSTMNVARAGASASTGNKASSAAASAGTAGRGLGGSAGTHAFPLLPDPAAELDALLRSSAATTARLQEAADSATAAASTAATERTRTAAVASSLQAQLSGAAIAYDSFVDIQKSLSAAVAVLRERAPLLQDLVRATALALGRLSAARAARRRMDVVDLLAEADADAALLEVATAATSSRVCAAVGCGDGSASALAAAAAAARAEAAAPLPAHAEAATVAAAMTLLGVAIAASPSPVSPSSPAVASDVSVAATADEVAASLSAAPAALRAERRTARSARVNAALRSLCDDACAGRLPTLHLDAWDAFDAPDVLERAFAAACLQPLAAAHSMLFADARAAAAGTVDALLQPFTQWKQGRAARKIAAGAATGSGAAAAVPAAVAAGVSAAYVRTFSYLAVQGLCEPLVAHGAWPWLLSSLATPHLQASGGSDSAAVETIDSLPWFGPLWQFGEVPLAAAAAPTPASGAGKQTPDGDADGDGAAATPSASAGSAASPAGTPSPEVAAAAASDESLLPRLVASALLPATLKLLPAAVDPLAVGATARIAAAGGLLSELHLYDLPADAARAIAAAAASALTQGCRSVIVPLILERPTAASASSASANPADGSAVASGGGSGWIAVDPDADGGSGAASGGGGSLRAAQPSPITLLYVGSALRALHSLVVWREAVPEPTLQHLALGTVIAGALRPLMDACLLGLVAEASLSSDSASISASGDGSSRLPAPVRLAVGPAARSSGTGDAHSKAKPPKQQPSAALVNLGGSVLASIAQTLPPQWLHSVLPLAADAGGSEADAVAAGQGLACLREWAGAARVAAASMAPSPAWLVAVAAMGAR